MITKIPSVWMIYIPANSENPATWINLAQVRYIERLQDELVIVYFDGSAGKSEDTGREPFPAREMSASVVCFSGDRARIFLEELARSPGLHYDR